MSLHGLRARWSSDRFGVIYADRANLTLVNFRTLAAVGVTHTLIPISWDDLQGSENADVTSADGWAVMRTRILNARLAGLRAVFDFGTQYPPTWVKTGVAKFRNQNAEDYSTVDAGDDVRDWIWTAYGQAKLADYVGRVLAGIRDDALLGLDKLDSLRLGTGFYGEVCYPRFDGFTPAISYWAFSAACQAGTDLAANQVVCPLPGYVPFAGGGAFSQSDARDQQWIDWYLDGQNVAVNFLIDTYRASGWLGDIYVLHPSFGIRSDWTSVASPAARPTAYRQEMAHGCDPKRLIQGYAAKPGAWPYSTWEEGTYNTTPPTVDSDTPSWRKVYDEAVLVGKASEVWAEVASLTATNADMDYVFDPATYPGAVAYGVRGAIFFYEDLIGGPATLAHFAAKIAAK